MTVWIAVRCPYCDFTDVVKYGKSPQGKQRYRCQNPECLHRTFIGDYSYQAYKKEVKQQITTMALNNSGVRDTARTLRISPHTVINELKKKRKR